MFKLNFPKFSREKGDTGTGIGQILIIILLGVGLLLITLGGKKENETEKTPTKNEEERLADLCSSLDGVGECRVFIAYEERQISYSSRTETVIVGIAVLCEGGKNDNVRARLTSLIDGLYGIGTNRIKIDEIKRQ